MEESFINHSPRLHFDISRLKQSAKRIDNEASFRHDGAEPQR